MNSSLFYIKTVMVFLLIACMGNAKASNFADLVPDNTATHTAIASGNWSNASIWNTGTVPNEAAIVIIPNGIDVNYNVDSEEHIFILRNDGHLSIKATNGKTRTLVVDTYLNSMGSTLDIDASQPTDGTIEIRFKAFNIEQKKRGEIDGATWSSEAISHYSDNKPVYGRNEVLRDGAGVWGRYAWDPDQATLGFMSAGVVTIEGKEKTPFLRTTKVTNVGVNKIELESIPSNWNVGDKVLLSGTTRAVYDEEHANGTEDEEFTITAIEGTEIALNKATVYRHQGIEEEGLYCHMSNLSRNVVFRSEGHGNVITKRGHVMFMMTTNVKVYNTQFKDLGRTDKYRLLDDFVYDLKLKGEQDELGREFVAIKNVGDKDIPENIDNQRGRYAFHFHRLKDSRTRMAEAHGCVIWGSPGWGMVHHDSHASFVDNVVYHIVGGGMISESGSETGIWEHNLVTSIIPNTALYEFADIAVNAGLNRESGDLLDDDFRFGDAYGNAGRAVRMVNNIASSAHEGFAYDSEGSLLSNRDKVWSGVYDLDMFPLQEYVDRGAVPILEFTGNESYGCNSAFRSKGRAPQANNHVLSIVENYKAWNIRRAIYITNNFGYLLRNVDFYGGSAAGLLSPNTDNINIVNCTYHEWKNNGTFSSGNVVFDDNALLNFVNIKTPDFGGDLYTDMTFAGAQVFDASVFNDDVSISFRKNNQMDTIVDLTTSDFTVGVAGQITDRLGQYRFGHRYDGTRFSDINKRVYDFENEEKLQTYLDEYGVFEDPEGVYTFLTEYISDRATGEIFPIKFRINLFGIAAPENTAPTITFISPSANESFENGNDIDVLVEAEDIDGSVVDVTLFINGEEVRKDEVSPYRWKGHSMLTNLPVGIHLITVIATDNKRATSTSELEIEIREPLITKLSEASLLNFSIYPNPSDHAIHILLEDGSSVDYWLLTDLQGKVLKNGVNNTVDIFSLNSGIYLLEVNGQVIRVLKK